MNELNSPNTAAYAVTLDSFQGPLDVLLQLIEQHELEITQISLAYVADQYMHYITTHSDIPPDEIADFLVIASKLILIKSKALLPTLELEDEDAVDLARQLKMYKQFVDASKQIEILIARKAFTHTRDAFPPHAVEGFQPPKKLLDGAKMRDIFALLLSKLEPVEVLQKRIIERTVTIKEKIQYIRDEIMRQAHISFQKTVLEFGTRSEKIVSFLAVLELAKQRIIDISQDTYLGDIIIRKAEGAELKQISTETEFLE